uniref:Schwannomin-interacting protein 1 n=1 Tax=Bactrocera dorsalis TaxID=27457 RepID=A0A034V9Q2_BACDO
MLDKIIFGIKCKINGFKKYQKCGQTDSDVVDGAAWMFPRVYRPTTTTMATKFIELSQLTTHIEPEFLCDVLDKFGRVTDPNVAESKRYSRRSDREEIRRRLAMGSEEPNQESKERNAWKTGIQSRLANAQLGRLNDPSSDTESHSSDSETCPKLSKGRQVDNMCALNISLADKPTYPYAGSGHASISSLSSAATANKYQIQQQMQRSHSKQQSFQTPMSAFSSEDLECDFFTKQAKLQIEARMALAQAKEMAHMQMEIERQNRRVSPITDIIRVSLRKVGVQMTADKRRVSRQMLTDMNIAQLQILVNSLHTHIEELNESLVHNLMERDDLHVSQDSMLVDIEELTRYIGANEHLAQRYKNQNHN